MATAVEMPQLGNTVEECIVSKWLKRVGDAVSVGDPVAEIETDKTTFEVAAPVQGTVLATFFEEGAIVPVFTNILVIGNPGENVDGFRPGTAPPRTAGERSGVAQPSDVQADPVAPTAETMGATGAVNTVRLSPRARKFAAEHDFHPASIIGSGPAGRVLEKDVRNAYARASISPSPSAPASSLRGTIARRMRESLASTAQYTMNSSADATRLLALRARIKSTAPQAAITINDLVTFCTIQALLEAPDVNAEFIEGRIVRHSEVHLAFAVDTPRGVIAPVVRNAHGLPIAELALRLKELTARSVQGRIAADESSGATFTITNLGSMGIESFTPLINPPQVAILGVGAIQLKPVRRNDVVRLREGFAIPAVAEAVEFVDSIGLSLTCDHQVIDGASGARFLQTVRNKIENVDEICRI